MGLPKSTPSSSIQSSKSYSPSRSSASAAPGHALGVVEHLVHHRARGAEAVAGDLGADLALGDLAGRELGAQIAEHLDGDAYVALDQAPQGLVALPAVEQLHRRDPQPLLVDLGRVRRVRAGDPAPDVSLVRGAARERDALAVHEHRLEHEDVGQVHPALEGVVQGVDVALAHVVVVAVEDRGKGGPHRAEVHRQGEALGDDAAPGVGDRGREVHVVAQHPGIGGAAYGHRHLVGGGEQGVLEELEVDRIDMGRRGTDVGRHGTPRGGHGRRGMGRAMIAVRRCPDAGGMIARLGSGHAEPCAALQSPIERILRRRRPPPRTPRRESRARPRVAGMAGRERARAIQLHG